MYRGTTPTITFTLPFDTSRITALNICFSQQGRIVLEKGLNECTLSENKIQTTLSETDTLSFDSEKEIVEMQLRVGFEEIRAASNIMFFSVERILKDGVLE